MAESWWLLFLCVSILFLPIPIDTFYWLIVEDTKKIGLRVETINCYFFLNVPVSAAIAVGYY